MAGACNSQDILAEILKRLPEKSLHQCNCVEKSWYNLIQSPDFKAMYSDSHRFIYMLACLSNWDFVLYRIDPNNNNSDSTHLHDLRPLLVFPRVSHLGINCFRCIKFGSKIYFFGLALSSQNKNAASVYTMEEKDLMGIQPSEDNIITNFKHLLTNTQNPMHGHKLYPIVFVANNKLYVLSGCYVKIIFEVFSPVDETWQVLPSPEDDSSEFHNYSDGVSYLVMEQEQMVYFATTKVLSSFNLQTHQWTIHTYFDSRTPAPPSTFGQQRFRSICIPIIGKMAFGILPDHLVSYVCASRTTSQGEECMQPYLAPDKAFLEVLRSSRFTYMFKQCSSDYIVALQDSDGKQQLCIITYGCKPLGKRCSPYEKANYVALSFYDIPGDFYTSEDRHVHEHDGYASSYADEKANDGGVIRRYFNAKFQYTKHFIISNSLHGTIETCFL